MAAGADLIEAGGRSCSRCTEGMEAVELRSGAVVWRCPTCRLLEI